MSALSRISVMMITGNVVARTPGRAIFERVLESVAWADELVVVDSDSSDGTREVAARFTPHIHIHPYRNSLKLQKQIGLEYLTGDWVLWVDADELLPPALSAEIRAAVASPEALGYRIWREHIFLGRPLRHSPDWMLRLWRRGVGRFEGPENDEFYTVPGPNPFLPTPMQHYSSARLSDRLQKMTYFAPAHAATSVLPEVVAYGWRDAWRLILRPSLQRFYGVYWVNCGYKDGLRGLIWAQLCAITEFFKYILIWERAEESNPPRESAP